jgi:hypothetical protein
VSVVAALSVCGLLYWQSAWRHCQSRRSNSLVFYGDGTGHDEDGIVFHYVAGDLKNPVPLPWCNVPDAAVDCKLKGAYRWHTDYTWHYAPDQVDPTKTAIWIDRTEVTYHGSGSQPVTVVDPVFPEGGPASRNPYPFEVGVPVEGHTSPDFIFTPVGPLPAQPGFKIEMTWHQLPGGV